MERVITCIQKKSFLYSFKGEEAERLYKTKKNTGFLNQAQKNRLKRVGLVSFAKKYPLILKWSFLILIMNNANRPTIKQKCCIQIILWKLFSKRGYRCFRRDRIPDHRIVPLDG